MRPPGDSLQLLVELGYDGSAFWGVQPTPAGPSVQGALFARLHPGAASALIWAISWAARTDRGVHACCNWVSLRVAPAAPPADLQAWRAAIVAALEAPAADGLRAVRVHVLARRELARAGAARKHYRYRLVVGAPTKAGDAGTSECAWHVDGQLDADLLHAAVQLLRGSLHRLRIAQPRAARAAARPSVDGHTAQLTAEPRAGAGGAIWRLDVCGPGFLRQQVRIMVAAVVAVAAGRLALHNLALLISPRAGPMPCPLPPAPAHGLTLQGLEPTPALRTMAPTLSGGGG